MIAKEKNLVDKICKNVNSPLRSQIETVVESVLAMQTQLEDNHDEFLTQPLSIQVTVGTGEIINRANPFVQEYRTLFKDYMNALVQLTKLIDDVSVEEEINTLSSIKEKIRLVK